MKLGDYKLIFVAGGLVGVLLIASPAIAGLIVRSAPISMVTLFIGPCFCSVLFTHFFGRKTACPVPILQILPPCEYLGNILI
jgi:hypothetical protein